MTKVKLVLNALFLFLWLCVAAALIAPMLPDVSPAQLSLTLVCDGGTFALGRLELAAAGFALLLGLLGLAAAWSASRRQAATLWYENPEGRVEIAISAVEDFVRRVAADFQEIREITPTIREGKDGIRVITRVSVWTGSSIPTLTQKIQHDIKDKIQNVLGIADVSGVEVSISSIQARPMVLTARETPGGDEAAPVSVPNQ